MIQLNFSPNDVKLLVRSLQFSKKKVEQDYKSNTDAIANTKDQAGIEILNHYIEGEAITIRKINAMIARLKRTPNLAAERELCKSKMTQGTGNGILYARSHCSNSATAQTSAEKNAGKVIFQ